MKKLLIVGAIALALAGCKTVDKALDTVQSACAKENTVHQTYLMFIAPFRPEAAVNKAKAFHARVQMACTTLRSIAEIEAAADAADAARRE